MRVSHTDEFERVLSLMGRKRPYFTRNPHELREPAGLEGTDIYVEVNLSANKTVSLVADVLSLFGYTRDDVTIEAR